MVRLGGGGDGGGGVGVVLVEVRGVVDFAAAVHHGEREGGSLALERGEFVPVALVLRVGRAGFFSVGGYHPSGVILARGERGGRAPSAPTHARGGTPRGGDRRPAGEGVRRATTGETRGVAAARRADRTDRVLGEHPDPTPHLPATPSHARARESGRGEGSIRVEGIRRPARLASRRHSCLLMMARGAR